MALRVMYCTDTVVVAPATRHQHVGHFGEGTPEGVCTDTHKASGLSIRVEPTFVYGISVAELRDAEREHKVVRRSRKITRKWENTTPALREPYNR